MREMEYKDSGCDAKAFRDTAVLKDTAILRDTAVEVNLTVLKNNMRLIKEMAGGDVSVMAVVKANAYGHSASADGSRSRLSGGGHADGSLGVKTIVS